MQNQYHLLERHPVIELDIISPVARPTEVVADLTRSVPSAGPATAVYNNLLERQRRFQVSLRPYGKQLGPSSGTKSWVSIKRKLQYAFGGASKVRDHIVSIKPEVDAALFHTMVLSI